LHAAAYRDLGLDWTFEALPVAPGQLAQFVAGLDDSWRGLAVTMPHKEALLKLGEPEPDALLVEAGNTLILGAQPKVFNTDISGFQSALCDYKIEAVSSAVLVGAGATARSALVALSRMGLRQVVIQSRSDRGVERLSTLAEQLGVEWSWTPIGSHEACDILVSTLPSGAADTYAEALASGSDSIFDVSYGTWPSVLANTARRLDPRTNKRVISGVDLLAGQAVRQIELFTGGSSVEAGRLRAAGWWELAHDRPDLADLVALVDAIPANYVVPDSGRVPDLRSAT
jgi:shikimate dehydrogenase